MERFLNPRSVVLIGVSRRSGVGAYNNLEMMQRFGYQGDIYVVHPKAREILGHRTYSSVRDLPGIPDVAVISVGRERVLPVFSDCVNKGIGRIVIISQGFADADERGKQLQQEIVAIAKKHGVRVIGPNTMGIFNAFSHFTTAFVDVPKDENPPPLTIIAQSGVLQVGAESFTGTVGKSIDIGNACDIDFVDVLEYLETDPETRVIVIHMEGVQRGAKFLRTASRIARHKPIIMFKTGRSPEGARAALSHTGSLVGEDSVVDAAFHESGLIRVHNMVELKAVCEAFLKWQSVPGPNVGVITATGACGIMTADACAQFGLRLAPFPEEARQDLENPHIAWHHLHNPVDIWPLGMVSGSFIDVLERTAKALLANPGVHSLLIIAPVMASPLHADLRLKKTLQAIQQANSDQKPIALWAYGDGKQRENEDLQDIHGLGLFDSIDEAIMGLAALWRYHQYKKREVSPTIPLATAMESPGKDHLLQGVYLGEKCSAILAKYDLPLVPETLTEDVDEALTWAEKNGYPVVIKAISPAIVHKSDVDAVQLHLQDSEALRTAYETQIKQFQLRFPDESLEGILIQKEVQGQELLMGIKRDPQFGSLIVIGMGGIYTEIFQDVAYALTPLTRSKAVEMMRSLRCYPILEGIRGRSPIRIDSVVDILLKVSQLAIEHSEIAELDLNPVIVNASACWIVDSRMVVG